MDEGKKLVGHRPVFQGAKTRLLLKSEIDTADYRAIKAESERKATELEAKLIEASKNTAGIQGLLDKAVDSLTRLDQLYADGDVKKKRQIVGSIFPEKLFFDGFRYRTARLNEAVRLIYKLDKDFSQNKNGQTEENPDLSIFVPRTGFSRHSLSSCYKSSLSKFCQEITGSSLCSFTTACYLSLQR